MKIKHQLILLCLLITVLVTSTLSILLYNNQKKVLRAQVKNQLESVAEAKKNMILSLMRARKELISFPARNSEVINYLKEYASTGKKVQQSKVNATLKSFVADLENIHKIHLLASDGLLIASSDASCIGQNWKNSECFKIAIQGRQYVDSLHFEDGKDYDVHISSPVYSESEITGVLVILRHATEIGVLTGDYTGLGRTGETYLGKKYGDSIIFLNPLRYDKNATLRRFIKASDTSVSMGLAYKYKKDTTVEALDYRGVPVLSALRYFPENGWEMVTEIDLEEAITPVELLKKKLFLLNGIAILIAVIGAYIMGSWLARPIEELTYTSNKLAEGDFTSRPALKANNETDVLARVFNVMADKIQQKIVRTESLFSTVFDAVEHGIMFFKVIRNNKGEIIDFEYVLANKSAESILSRSRGDLIGKRQFQEYPFLRDIGIFDKEVEAITTGKSSTTEFYYGYQGLNRWYRNKFIKISNDELLLTFDDITEQKEASMQMENMQSIILQSQELGKIGSYEYDLDTHKYTWSYNLYRIHGYEPQGYNITLDTAVQLIHPDDREYVMELFREQIYQDESVEYEYKFLRKDGTLGTAHGKARVVRDASGRAIKIIGFMQDITDRVRVLEQLRELNIQLEQKVEERTRDLTVSNNSLKKVNASLDKYAYFISHDLKASLSSIEGLVPFIKEDYQDKPLDNPGLEMLDMISEKAHVMRNIIDNVLHAAKEEKQIKEPVNLSLLVREVINTLHPPSHFRIEIREPLPVVKYNRTSLIQIFQNIISNAIKYMDKAEPLIKITSESKEGFYHIAVIDNGQGIPQNKINKIFEPFEIAHKEETIESHGLGLSIVKQLVESQGGKVWAESNPGVETCFYFTIPAEE